MIPYKGTKIVHKANKIVIAMTIKEALWNLFTSIWIKKIPKTDPIREEIPTNIEYPKGTFPSIINKITMLIQPLLFIYMFYFIQQQQKKIT